MSAPSTATQALARDLRLASQVEPVVADLFRKEHNRHRRTSNYSQNVRVEDWEELLADVWTVTGNTVFTQTFEQLTGKKVPTDQRAKQELVALIARLIRDGREAETIATYIEEASLGIVTTTRRRIQTVLRRIPTPSGARKISRALRRLYLTDFIKTRANRIALDQVLRATATYEHGAALLAQEVTGREYIQLWRNQGDSRVRDSHIGISPVALGEPFKVGGELLRFPRDPAGPAHETYGCRCWTERKRL